MKMRAKTEDEDEQGRRREMRERRTETRRGWMRIQEETRTQIR